MDQLARIRETIVTAKCSICDHPLTVPPITIISNDGAENRCGRCKDIVKKFEARNVIYENAAMHLTFPCIYEGCQEQCLWGEVENHEKLCLKRTIRCPIYYENCHNMIEVSKIESHFRENHPNNVRHDNSNKAIAGVRLGHDTVLLLIVDEACFFMYIMLDSSLHPFISVFSIDPTNEDYIYNTKVTSNNRNGFSIQYVQQEVKFYNERKFCFKCLEKKCTIKYHIYSKVNGLQNRDAVTTKLNHSSLRELTEDSEIITFTIEIIPVPIDGAAPMSPRQENNKLFQKSLECAICHEYMCPPIFTCVVGHTICNICRRKLENCPTCKREFGEGRNFSLEELSDNIEMPCQQETFGCNFLGNVARVSHHQMNGCEYAKSSKRFKKN